MNLVERIYATTKHFPRHELWGLTSQMRRAAVSIPSNIAEGHTRQYTKEFLQQLATAQASLAELQTQLEIAVRLAYVEREIASLTLLQMTDLAKQLYALRNALQRRRANSLSPNPQPLSPGAE